MGRTILVDWFSATTAFDASIPAHTTPLSTLLAPYPWASLSNLMRILRFLYKINKLLLRMNAKLSINVVDMAFSSVA